MARLWRIFIIVNKAIDFDWTPGGASIQVYYVIIRIQDAVNICQKTEGKKSEIRQSKL
jgi:hypothetical protein